MAPTALVQLGGDVRDVDTDALDRALDIAARYDDVDAVHALFVVDTRRYGEPALSSDEIVVDNLEDAGHEMLARFRDLAVARGLAVETRCCHGAPHEELVDFAANLPADVVIVVGRRPPHRLRKRLDAITSDVVYMREPALVRDAADARRE